MKIYVSAAAFRDGNGTADRPFKRIGDAAKIAKPGDEVLVAPGIYREYVDPANAGTEDQRITYRSTEPLGAVITGAEEIKSWQPYEGNVWVCRVDNTLFGSYNPYTTYVYGDWYFAGRSKHTGCVYLNDKAMYEASSLEECLQGQVYPCSWEPEASVYKWYTQQEDGKTVLYGNFQGKNRSSMAFRPAGVQAHPRPRILAMIFVDMYCLAGCSLGIRGKRKVIKGWMPLVMDAIRPDLEAISIRPTQRPMTPIMVMHSCTASPAASSAPFATASMFPVSAP